MKRKQKPARFVCNIKKKSGLWRFNPRNNATIRPAYVGFVDSSLGRDNSTYSAYVRLMNKKTLEARFNELITKGKNSTHIDDVRQGKINELVKLVFTMTHHPRYYKVDPKRNATRFNFVWLDEPDVPEWVRDPTEGSNYKKKRTKVVATSSLTTTAATTIATKKKNTTQSLNHHQNNNNNKNKSNNKNNNNITNQNNKKKTNIKQNWNDTRL